MQENSTGIVQIKQRGKNISNILLNDLLKLAIDKFYQNDAILLKKGVKGIERSSVFRIGIYLQEFMNKFSEFDNLNLDCEYNKKDIYAKDLYGQNKNPDLIIHKRLQKNNKMIVEFKGWWNHRDSEDIDKLEKFTLQDGDYGYQLGVFVKLNEGNYTLQYFKDGKKVSEDEI